jgi:hypothetical protein
LSPKVFRPADTYRKALDPKDQRQLPFGTTVTYTLSAAAQVEFFLERKLAGREAYRPLPGTFGDPGQAGRNTFEFSGRNGPGPLRPGEYILVGETSAAVRRAKFEIGPRSHPRGGSGHVLSLEIPTPKFFAYDRGGPTSHIVMTSSPPVNTGVSYELSAPAVVNFRVETVLDGRTVPARGGFQRGGRVGPHSFAITGRLGGRTLPLGHYRLVASANGSTARAPFEIVGVCCSIP